MRKLLWLIPFLFLCGRANATIAPVGSTANSCNASGCSATYSPTAGHLLVAVVASAATGGTIACSDNGSGGSWSNSFTNTAAGSNTFAVCYSCSAVASITSVSFTNSAGGSDSAIVLTEYSGAASSSCQDQVSSVGTGTGTTVTAGSITTTQANELLFGGVLITSGAFGITGTSSFTNRQDTGWNNETNTALDRIVSSTGTYAASGTVSSCTWYAYTVSFKQTSGAATGGTFKL